MTMAPTPMTYKGTWVMDTSSTTNAWANISPGAWSDSISYELAYSAGALKLSGPAEYKLPDGSVLHIDAHGNFRVEDDDAQVTYRAHRNRAFNPYVNAGDMVAAFIDFVRTVPGVRRDDVSSLPLQLFVHWLIIQAAKRDGDPVPDDVEEPPRSRLLTARVRPQCALPTCRRFIRKGAAQHGFRYCDPGCANEHHARLAA